MWQHLSKNNSSCSCVDARLARWRCRSTLRHSLCRSLTLLCSTAGISDWSWGSRDNLWWKGPWRWGWSHCPRSGRGPGGPAWWAPRTDPPHQTRGPPLNTALTHIKKKLFSEWEDHLFTKHTIQNVLYKYNCVCWEKCIIWCTDWSIYNVTCWWTLRVFPTVQLSAFNTYILCLCWLASPRESEGRGGGFIVNIQIREYMNRYPHTKTRKYNFVVMLLDIGVRSFFLHRTNIIWLAFLIQVWSGGSQMFTDILYLH